MQYYHLARAILTAHNRSPAPGFTFPTELTTVEGKLLDCISTVTNMAIDELSTITGLLSLQHPLELFGFFSVPIKYHKHGVRFEVQGRFRDFGFAIQTGVASISQVAMYIDQQQHRQVVFL